MGNDDVFVVPVTGGEPRQLTFDDTINIWGIAPAGGAPVQVTRDRGDGLQFPSISPDGKTIA